VITLPAVVNGQLIPDNVTRNQAAARNYSFIDQAMSIVTASTRARASSSSPS
jgi:hypothetical protein